MFLILTLIILVAAFNIITGLIMLVKDKGRDVAVLRTMGATKGMIMRIFFMDGAFIGVVGTALGLILGILFCENIESIRQLLQDLSGRELFSAEIYFYQNCRQKSILPKWRPLRGLRCCCRFWPQFIRRIGRQKWIQWRLCVMNNTETILQLKQIGKSFKQGTQKLDVLKGVDFEIKSGEIVALIGPSGSGKSTLLQISGLLEPPTAGEIFLNNQNCSKLGDGLRTLLRRDFWALFINTTTCCPILTPSKT